MAGFQVTLYGRIWATPEDSDPILRVRGQFGNHCHLYGKGCQLDYFRVRPWSWAL